MQGFRLDGGGETLVCLTPAAGAPRLAYWGPALDLDSDPIPALAALADRGVPGSVLDGGEALSWLPEAGHGFTGHPGLAAHRDGMELISQMTARSVVAADGVARIVLADDLAEVELAISLALDGSTGVLTSRATLTNRGGRLTLDWLAAGALDCPHAELMLFDGRWAREFIPVRQSLTTGLIMKENRTGRTSHHAPPFMVIGARRSVAGWPSGTSIDSEDTLRFSSQAGVRAMVEVFPLGQAAEAYQRMMSGKARFRVVLRP